MRKINTYITEKLKIDKDISVQKEYEIKYKSTAISRVNFLNSYIYKKIPVEKYDTEIVFKRGLVTCYKMTVYDKDDYLWLLVCIYERVSNEARNIREDFDKKMNETVHNYNKDYKEAIHKLFTMDEIYDRYIEYRKRNNI